MNYADTTSVIIFTVIFAIAVIVTLFMVAYLLDRFVIGAAMRRYRRAVAVALPQQAGVMGEAEMMWEIVQYWTELPFTYARMALYSVIVLMPAMLYINITHESAYMMWNLCFSAFIVIFAIKMGVRWQIFLGALGLGSVFAWLASTEEDQRDLTEGALKGLNTLMRFAGAVIVGVWILSILLSVISWAEHPTAFVMIVLGLSGYYIFTSVRGYERWWWLLDIPVIGLFLAIMARGILEQFEVELLSYVDWGPMKGFLLNDHGTLNLENLGTLMLLALVGLGVYFYNNEEI